MTNQPQPSKGRAGAPPRQTVGVDSAADLHPGSAEDRAKEASRALAQRLATPEGARAARLSQREGTLRLPEPALPLPAPPIPAPPLPAPPLPATRAEPASTDQPLALQLVPLEAPRPPRPARPISIWQPRGEGAGLVFVRPDPLPLGDHFAARRELRPKAAPLPLRVCLFGESAAAGYLYAPHLTPAGVLEAQLRAVAGEDAVEVIDLARTNETLSSMVATLESAVQIQPDVLVLFAGNNWNLLETPEVSPYAPSVTARQRYAAAWRAAGPAGPVALAAERLRDAAAAAFERVALIAHAIGVPVILVVPEASLDGWESRQPVAWLPAGGPGGAVRPLGESSGAVGPRRGPAAAVRPHGGPPPIARWYRLLARARRHLERGARTAAARAAEAMRGLDGGANPTSWRLLASARAGVGDERAATAAARAEIDAAAYPALAFLGAPQATTLAQDLVRQAANRHGFACVDLPAVFAAHTGSPLPGRRLFLDYCHLTAEGIEVAMAAVACEALRLAGMEAGAAEPESQSRRSGAGTVGSSTAGAAAAAGELGWRELLRRLPPLRVPAPVEAVARLGAAVHGAHRLLAVGPKVPLLEAWCDAALDASPGIESAMRDLLAARAAPLPAVLTPAQRRNLASDVRLGLPHGWRWDHVDADLTEAIVSSLERHGRPEARAEADALLLAGRGIRPTGTDLLDPAYPLWEPLERFYPEVMSFEDLPRPATLRAPWPETSLCLICAAGSDATLEVTARLPLLLSPTPGQPFGPAEDGPPPHGNSPEAPPPHGSGQAAFRHRRGIVRVSVNGHLAAALPLRETWKRSMVRVPGNLLRQGRNRLTFHWPFPAVSGDAAVAAALARLDEGIAADLHPVFGEIYSVVARRQ